MVRTSTFLAALLGPAAVCLTGLLVVLQLAIFGHVTLLGWIVLAAAWGAGLALRALRRQRRLLPFLAHPPRQMRRLSRYDFGVRSEAELTGGDEIPYTPPAFEGRVIKALSSRRLVLLRGDRLTGKTRTAFEVLKHAFGRYMVLRPELRPASEGPPLAALLGTTSPWRRYILWLDDVAPLLDAGLDPRVIERWLASGRSRIAIATITPSALARVLSSGTSAAAALERAVQLPVEAATELPSSAGVSRRYRDLQRSRPKAAALMRVVATWELLGINATPDADSVAAIATTVIGGYVSGVDIRRACGGTPPPVHRDGGILRPHPELVSIVDREAPAGIDAAMLNALTRHFHDSAADLLAIGQSLAARGQLREAEEVLGRARLVAGDDLRPAITSALVNVFEIRKGPSGARLSNAGGWDFEEPMGPAQRDSAERILPTESDAVFDPTSPPDEEGWRSRFYRLTLRRAVARVMTLMLVDGTAILVASVCALGARAIARGGSAQLIDEDLGKLVVSTVPVTIAIAVWIGLYRADAARARLPQILGTMTLVSIIVAAGFLVARVETGSVAALVVLFVVAVIVDWALRAAYDEVSRRWVRRHRFGTRVLVLGDPENARRCARNLGGPDGRPVQVVAYLSPTSAEDDFEVGTYDDLEARLHELHIAELVIADRALSTTEKGGLIARAQRLGLGVRYVANEDEIILGAAGRLDDHGLVRAPAALLSQEALELKRLIDRVIVTATLPIWGSMILLYATYSKIRRPGQPVFILEDRVGLGGVGFSILRLRTRTFHPDGGRGTLPTGRVEAFAERSGLDEVPQMINVLRGEMALVGPRTLSALEVADLSVDQRRTLTVRPCMTGPWQVSLSFGESEGDMRAADAYYLRHWRVSHDIALLLRTPIAIVRRGFYLGETEIQRQRERMMAGRPQPRWT